MQPMPARAKFYIALIIACGGFYASPRSAALGVPESAAVPDLFSSGPAGLRFQGKVTGNLWNHIGELSLHPGGNRVSEFAGDSSVGLRVRPGAVLLAGQVAAKAVARIL